MTFEWDNSKNELNKKKHDGISFEFAVRVFLDKKRKLLFLNQIFDFTIKL